MFCQYFGIWLHTEVNPENGKFLDVFTIIGLMNMLPVLIHIHISYGQNNNSSVSLFSMHFARLCLCYRYMPGNIPLKHEYGIWNLLIGMNKNSVEVW